jgi:capsular polysaccharide export protein
MSSLDAQTEPRERSWHTVATFSRGVARLPALTALLGARTVVLRPGDDDARGIDAVIGWGEKANTRVAVEYAKRHGIPYWRAEDGFVRSVGLGVSGEPPLSIVLDDEGIYYDARRASRLERLITEDPDARLLARARAAIDRIVGARLSKYNDAPPGPLALPPKKRVLVVDQTRGDLSIECGLADAASFERMLDAALAENPDAEVLVKVHPDVLAGKKAGYLADAARPRVKLFAEPANPYDLIALADRVYVVTSQVGFEALLAGKPVTCFGAPFYAGWGLTDDRVAIPRRTSRRSLEQLVAAALIRYPRYRDPSTGEACELERVLDHLALQRAMFEKNRGTIFCFGFQFWKRNYVRAYLRCPGNRVVFAYTAAGAARRGLDHNARILVWGRRDSARVRNLAARHGVPIWRMEDGFLRSVGLGAELTTPASLVVDREGIYFDPTQPSELESILERGGFDADELARAASLRRQIVDRGLSKYNVGEEVRIEVPAGRRVILVPGQVESDQSVRVGCPGVRTNLGLLEEVRRAAPDAFVIYKPHPDVVSGNRAGQYQRTAALTLCDHLEERATLPTCLAVAGEVHCLTSLVGFEALLRGKKVVVYGQPFYAGWGLTEDRHPVARRTRKITLDELVAGALIRYPRYLDRKTFAFTTPEAVIAELTAERATDAAARVPRVSWPRRTLRKLVRAYRGVVHAP